MTVNEQVERVKKSIWEIFAEMEIEDIDGISLAKAIEQIRALFPDVDKEAGDIIKCVKDAKRVHPDWGIDEVIILLEFREETKQAMRGKK